MTLSGSQTVTRTLNTSIDTAKSFLIFTSNTNIDRPVSVVRCQILNTNTVQCVRVSSDTSPVEVRFSVVTYESGIYVQRGTASQSSTTNDITLPYGVLSTNNAFVLYSKTVDATDVSRDGNDPIGCRLLDPLTVRCEVNGAASGHQINWEVVEFLDPDDIYVQSGTTSTTGLSAYVTLGTPVQTKKTFVLGGFYSVGGDPQVGRALMQSRLIDEDTISFHRGATGNTMNIVYQVVELKDGSTVYRGNQSFATGTGTHFVNLPTTIDTTLAVAFSGTQTGGGQNQGNTTYVGSDTTGVSEYTLNLSTTQINITRRNTVAPADVGWFVIDFQNLLPNFTEITSTANLGTTPNGGSIAFLDCNNDGYLDIYMNDDDNTQSTHLLRQNDGDNTFTDRDSQISSVAQGRGAGAGDYDNDGDVDLIMGHSGVLATNTNGASCSFSTSDIDGDDSVNPEAMMFVDIDKDGDLDVWSAGQNSKWTENDPPSWTETPQIPGITSTAGNTESASAADIDNDGYLDLIVAQNGGVSHLYHNEGDGTFANRADAANIDASGHLGKTIGFFDSDNDGDLDFVTNNPLTFWRNNLYDHTDPSSNANEFLKVMAFGNATANKGSPKTPIGALIQIKQGISYNLLAYREVIPSQNQLAPPHIQHFGGLDPDTSYNVEVLFPSGANVTVIGVIPALIEDSEYSLTYGSYTVPQALNVTEPAYTNLYELFEPMRDSSTVDDVITWTLTKGISDEVSVDDNIVTNRTPGMNDSTIIDDFITWTLTRRVNDDIALVEDILIIGQVNSMPKDSTLTEDFITIHVTSNMKDSVTSEDDIITIGVELFDDIALVEDILIIGQVNSMPKDSALVDDVLSARTTKIISDSGISQDTLSKTATMVLQDVSATIDDIILIAPANMLPKDTAFVEGPDLKLPPMFPAIHPGREDRRMRQTVHVMRDSA